MTKIHNQRLLVATGLSFLIWGMVGVIIGPLLPETVVAYSLNSTQAGFIFFSWSTGFSVGAYGSRSLLSRVRPDVLLAALTLGATLCSTLLYFSNSFTQYLFAFCLLGLSGGATFTAAHTLIGRYFPGKRTAALSSLDVVFSLGNMISPLMLVLLFSFGFTWKLPFLLVAAAFLVSAVIFAIIFMVAPADAKNEHAPKRTTNSAGATTQKTSIAPLMLLGAASFFLGSVEWAQNIWFVTYSIEQGMGETFARVCQSVFLLGMIGARVVAILAGDLVHTAKYIRFLFVITLLGNVAIVFTVFAPAHVVGNLLMGAGIGAMFPIFLGRAMDIDPSRSSSFSAVMIICLAAGGQLSSVAVGTLSEMFDIADAFALSTFFSVLLTITFEAFRIYTRNAHAISKHGRVGAHHYDETFVEVER